MEQVKKDWMFDSIEEAFQRTGKTPIDPSIYPEDMRDHMEGYYIGLVLFEAVKIGEEPLDWDDWNQEKYIPYFDMSPSAFRFGVTICGYARAIAGSGSRLRTLDPEKAKWLAEKFPEVWEKVQLK